MKSYSYRNNPLFLRNEFECEGKWGFPVVKKQEIDLSNIELIACSDISKKDTNNLHKGVHFFVDDYRFDSFYDNPDRSLDTLKKYRFVLSPDYSLYAEMNPWRQIESVGKNRWVAAKWQNAGLVVIPTFSWGLSRSYEFCFDSVEKHCIAAIGMIGCKGDKKLFLRGYYQMLDKIEPEAIICFGDPYKEMDGNIIPVNYLDSRKVVR